MLSLSKGRYRARFAAGPADVTAAQRLRHQTFIAARGGARADGLDADAFDAICRHVLIEEESPGPGAAGDGLVACFRLLELTGGAQIGRSYSAQHYDLSALKSFGGPIVEMGRFCIRPDRTSDPDILRVAWGAMAGHVDSEGIELLFGCSSFPGTEAAQFGDAFALLNDRHLAPARWAPRVRAPEVFRFGPDLPALHPDPRRGMLAMPSLLRSYLTLGGWVSDHAVVDRDLGTMHVFTGLEIRAIPESRKRLLRATAA